MTTYTKVAKPSQLVTMGGSPIGLLLSLTYATTTGTAYTKVSKANGTSYTKITKAVGTTYTKITKAT